MIDPDYIPPLEDLLEPATTPADPRSDAHLAMLNKYRAELAQGFRCMSSVSGHLAIIAETGKQHEIFDQQVEVLTTLIRQVDSSLTCLRTLAESQGTA